MKKRYKGFRRSMHKLLLLLRHYVGRLTILGNRLGHAVYIKRMNGKVRLVVNERHKKLVTVSSRVALLISIALAFIAIPPPISIYVSLGLIAIEQLLERVGFYYLSVYVVDFPPWEVWRRAGFSAMIFGRPEEDGSPMLVGMAFTDEDAARTVWGYITAWAISDVDSDDSLRITIVVNEKAKKYAVFVYPAYDRAASRAFREQVEGRAENKDMEHRSHQAQMMIIKTFPLRKDSSLNVLFRPCYKPGGEFVFKPFLYAKGDVSPIQGAKPIKKYNLELKGIGELTTKDPEYHSSKFEIDWSADEGEVPRSFYYGREKLKNLGSKIYR